jgi:poly(3-hydroxybutyrate) depolymerase/DNA-binding beta-propeller fold protein YncE
MRDKEEKREGGFPAKRAALSSTAGASRVAAVESALRLALASRRGMQEMNGMRSVRWQVLSMGLALAALLLSALPGPAAARVTVKITLDGIVRQALVDPGKDATAAPSPLVFVFHYAGASAVDMTTLGLAEAWPEATIVYPQGSTRPDSLLGLSATGWQYHPGGFDDQDVRFVDALVNEISATYKVDERQIFATGSSSGTAFCYVLLTMCPERFAAFAPVAGVSLPCLKWARVARPVLITQGKADPFLSFSWAERARNQLQRLYGGTLTTSPTVPDPSAAAPPVLLRDHDGGHGWVPGTTEAVVRFFKEHPLATPALPSPAAGAVDTRWAFVGSGRAGFAGDGSAAATAQFLFPEGLALDSDGGLFIADTGNQRIRKIGPDGLIRTIAGRAGSTVIAQQAPDKEGIAATRAYLCFPESVTADREGNLFLADTLNRLVRKVTPAGVIATVAGRKPIDTTIGFSGDNGPAFGAQLSFPTGLAIDRSGRLFIADSENHRVRMVDLDGTITTVAGTGVAGSSGDQGPARQAELNEPWGLACDLEGELFIADASNHRIRKVAPDGTIATVAGTGTAGFSGDGGPAIRAELNHPLGLAVDSEDNLYIVDQRNYRVRRVAPDGVITTVFGGAGSDDGAAAAPRYYPSSVAVDRSGNLVIADPFHHRIWKVSGVAAPGLIAGQLFPEPEPPGAAPGP